VVSALRAAAPGVRHFTCTPDQRDTGWSLTARMRIRLPWALSAVTITENRSPFVGGGPALPGAQLDYPGCTSTNYVDETCEPGGDYGRDLNAAGAGSAHLRDPASADHERLGGPVSSRRRPNVSSPANFLRDLPARCKPGKDDRPCTFPRPRIGFRGGTRAPRVTNYRCRHLEHPATERFSGKAASIQVGHPAQPGDDQERFRRP